MNALEPGTVLYAETARPYPVAHADESGTLWLDFGQHAGTPLHEVPDRYLRWMVQAGKVFLPEDLIDAAAATLAMRQTAHRTADRTADRAQEEPLIVPDLRDAPAVIDWAQHTGTAGDVSAICYHMRLLANQLEAVLDERAERTTRRLFAEPGPGATC
jgi:uncharacterized protein (DUF3820 family)